MQDLVTNMKLTPATSVPNSFLRLPAILLSSLWGSEMTVELAIFYKGIIHL